jgi:transcriptional regulator with XRE-family HTH domain
MSQAFRSREITEFGQQLRQWRQIRGMSQLDLAMEADSSARHLSFIETGRSRPSRDMVLRLAEVLEMPLRERNRLLTAAGYSAAYRETALDAAALEQVRRVLDRILEKQEPYPAIVMNRCFDILMINHGGASIMNMLGLKIGGTSGPPNLLRLLLHPEGLKSYLMDWEGAAQHMIQRAHRQVRGEADTDPLARILEEVLAYPGVPTGFSHQDPTHDAAPVLPLEFRVGEATLSWITTVASFGTPQDVTAEEIMVESMFPANRETEQAIAVLVNGAP